MTRRTIRCTVFETPLGACALAWTDDGIVRLQLPEGSRARTLARLRASVGEAVPAPAPPGVRAAIARVQRHLGGEPQRLDATPLDMRGVSPFAARVYRTLGRTRPGETLSYGELARRIGSPGAARAVGRALAHNPFALFVPCHRVLSASAGIGGFSARGGARTKARLLALEGSPVTRRR
jgi:methylated-DNA-[protein]-cysteine S-methyltransferase